MFEIGDDGRIAYDGRFDEDDFEGAYRELERRYYAGEGAAFAEAGGMSTEWVIAVNEGDFDRAFGELMAPGMRVENRSRSAFPDRRSAPPARAIGNSRRRLPRCGRGIRWCAGYHPTGPLSALSARPLDDDDETYTWTWLCVCGLRDGRTISACLFDPEDEAAAFAYAEECMRAVSSRLAVTNRASETLEAGRLAMLAHDVDALVALYSDRFEYDDRRRLSGAPRDTRGALRVSVERLLDAVPPLRMAQAGRSR